jgi:hypothetical protein
VQICSLLGGYPGHDALPHFFTIFSKNPDNRVETDRTSGRVFDGNSILWKVKATACVGWGTVVCSKFLVPTPLWLWHEDLRTLSKLSGLRPTSFQKHSGDRPDSSPKTTSQTKPRQATSRTFRVLRGCERVVTFSGLRGPSFLTPMPLRLQSKVLTFLSLTTKMVQTVTVIEMLVDAYNRHRWVHTSSNGTRGRRG